MFKFQDLLYAKRVGATWASDFMLFLSAHADSVSTLKELNKPSPAQGIVAESGKVVENISWKDYYLYRLQDMLDSLLKSFDGNRQWQRSMVAKIRKMGLPTMPVQYNIDKYFQQEFSDKAEQFIDDYKDKVEEEINAQFNKGQDEFPLPSNDNYKNVKNFVDTLRKVMVDILQENQLYYARPSYDNLWLYCGEIDDKSAPNTFQGLHVITYTPEQWDKVHFSRDYLRDNKFVLSEDEFVVAIDHYAVLKDSVEDDSYFKDGHSYVHFDKDHRPVDVLTFMPDDDILENWLTAFGEFRRQILPDDLYQIVMKHEELSSENKNKEEH